MDTLHDILHSLINHFIPHEGNDYRPHLLQKAAFFGLLGMALLTFTLANFQALLWQSSAWLVSAVLPAVVVDLTNEQRTENNLATLVRNPVLDAAAQLKAQDMAAHEYFAHNSPSGVTPWHWFSEAGYSYVYAGENLAVYFTDSTAVVDAWMASPGHRANIVGSQYREIGVGTAKGKYNGYDTVFVVQLFGTPAVKAAPAVTAVKPAAPLARPAAKPVAALVATSSREVPQVAGEATATAETVSSTPLTATGTRATTTTVVATATATPALAAVAPVADEAVPVTNEPVPVVPPVAAPSSEHITTSVTEDGIAINLGMATSATDLAPAPVAALSTPTARSTPLMARLATTPHHTLQIVYTIIGILTSLALFASVMIAWRQHRPMQTAYGVLLLLLMCGLFVLHSTLTVGAIIV